MRAAPLDALDRTAALQPGAPARAPAAGGPAPVATVSQAPTVSPLDAALQSAASVQGGLNALFADLASALQGAALPPQAERAAVALLQAELPLDPPPSAEALRAATAASGLFYEANLAAGAPAAPFDLKALLLQLQAALPQAGGASGGGETPPPPTRDGAQLAQPALAALLAQGLAPEALLGRVSRRVSAALGRQVLMQAASAGVGRRGTDAAESRAWLFELPLATPQGAAVAQFEIDADDTGDQATDRRTWRTRFTFDVAPIGPVHARISFSAGQTRVALWVEDAETLQQLSSRREELDAMLAEADLPAQISILPGAPASAPPPPPGRFVARSA